MPVTTELLRQLNLPQFEDSETARRFLEAEAWPNGPVCPHCGTIDRAGRLDGRTTRAGLWKCYECRRPFTITVGTVFQSSKLPLHKWLQATAIVWKKPTTILEMRDSLGVEYLTARRMRQIIRPGLDLRSDPKPRQMVSRLCYPFIEKPRLKEHELLLLINDVIPRGIPEDRRADICQELAVAVLCGDVPASQIEAHAKRFISSAYRMYPNRHGPTSLDANIGDTDFRLIDTLAAGDGRWDFA